MNYLAKRRALVELIHAFEDQHLKAVETLGFCPYRVPGAERSEANSAAWDEALAARQAAEQLRGMLYQVDVWDAADRKLADEMLRRGA